MRLHNLANLLPASHNYSRIYRGWGELIDHIPSPATYTCPVWTVPLTTSAASPLQSSPAELSRP